MERKYKEPTIDQVGAADAVDGYKSMLCYLAPGADIVRVALLSNRI